MNQQQYTLQEPIPAFIEWMNDTCQEGNYKHEYYTMRPRGHWQCHSIFHAYEAYKWGFSSFDPHTGLPVKGNTYAQSSDYLQRMSTGLKSAVTTEQEEKALQYCRAIMQWGGVLWRNEDALKRFTAHDPLTVRLIEMQQRLAPAAFTLSDDMADMFINSGFSKIYSLLIDDFVIYDSRVGAALGLLVRKFCEESGLKYIPNVLKFAYADAPAVKGHTGPRNVRDAGTDHYKFPKLNNNVSKYINNNMRANWLIKAIAHHPGNAFSTLPDHERMRALEAALFMVGYKVW